MNIQTLYQISFRKYFNQLFLERTTARTHNKGFAISEVLPKEVWDRQCFADTFVVNQTLIFRINTYLQAGGFVVKIATFTKRQNIMRHAWAT